jgi:hypothetical protein
MCQKIFLEEREEGDRRVHNVIGKPTSQCGSETCVLREEDKRTIEASEMRFLWPLLCTTLRGKRSTDTRKQSDTE